MNVNMIDVLAATVLGLSVLIICVLGYNLFDAIEYEKDFDLGSVVTTTAEYEYLTNDSFTGVVVRGEGSSDPALTVRNRDGVERRIATEFLEPMRGTAWSE